MFQPPNDPSKESGKPLSPTNASGTGNAAATPWEAVQTLTEPPAATSDAPLPVGQVPASAAEQSEDPAVNNMPSAFDSDSPGSDGADYFLETNPPLSASSSSSSGSDLIAAASAPPPGPAPEETAATPVAPQPTVPTTSSAPTVEVVQASESPARVAPPPPGVTPGAHPEKLPAAIANEPTEAVRGQVNTPMEAGPVDVAAAQQASPVEKNEQLPEPMEVEPEAPPPAPPVQLPVSTSEQPQLSTPMASEAVQPTPMDTSEPTTAAVTRPHDASLSSASPTAALPRQSETLPAQRVPATLMMTNGPSPPPTAQAPAKTIVSQQQMPFQHDPVQTSLKPPPVAEVRQAGPPSLGSMQASLGPPAAADASQAESQLHGPMKTSLLPPPAVEAPPQDVLPGQSAPPPPSQLPEIAAARQPMDYPSSSVPPPNRPAPPTMGGGMRELRVEDALLYLDDVKREFGHLPRIYNEFLEIMKNFKSHEVDTPGVIDRVSRLFRGYNKLILGFNKFLPDGYKISLEDLERRDAEEARREAAASATGRQPYYPGGTVPQQQQQGLTRGPVSGQAAPQFAAGAPASGQGVPQFANGGQAYPPARSPPGAQQTGPGGQMSPGQQKPPPQQAMTRGPPQQQMQQLGPPQPPPQHQAVEFDHAISYVTNIKKRFANDPGTYHAFLEILHTYQKEQRGIKEVLEQVASLFADHPDLLKEFTFFLPDAVQEQAKERLHRAAADSEARQAAAARGMDYDQMAEYRGRMQQGSQKVIDMTGQQQMYVESSPLGRQRPPGSRKRPFSPRDGMVPMPPSQPETFVYNSAVERQFFDAAKEALTAYTRDGGQAWAEFLKCLDMYGQEILSRNEMLNFVEPLLGKRNSELFEEFKRILAAAGAPPGPAPSLEDSWYSVPLSEIDFSRCRRCSPSYRALPRDYPDPPCSDRSEEEAKILNDVWVSLPVGSEESYTFRHMRRNQHEETLFRCEDERFEIDMVIDSNACTLRRLEPIAEEIAQLAKEENLTPDLLGPTKASLEEGRIGGMGGLRFQYTFDKDILGLIHRNSISRIYGDAGQEMLELIVNNPTVAVPVVVQRLRQKDREWRGVRERLNRHWKELAEQNYYRSLDHRSLTWRTVDKRATSTRTLISDIKDRAANGGRESDVAVQARLDKNKEEFGSFYEVTMAEYLRNDLDLKMLPKPDKRLFTPHMSIMYEHDSWAQRDAYRILTFALERGNSSPLDKERFHRFWRDFLGPWLGLSLNWMQQPAVAFQESALSAGETAPSVVSHGDDSQDDEEDSRSVDDVNMGDNVVTEEMKKEEEVDQWMDHHPLPAGAAVSTVFGEGRILQFRAADSKYVVSLPFGKGYLTPHAVLCTVLTVEKSAYTNQLRDEDRSKLERPDDMLVIGTQSLYLFFRLHQILIRRLGIAKELAYKVPHDRSLKTLVEQMSGEDTGRRRYEAYLSLVYALLDGGGHSAEGKYEDRVRCLLGHGAYELATMDKLISHIVKNIQSMGGDDTMQQLVQLFRRHYAAGSFQPDSFRQEAAYLSDGEAMYAFQGCKVPDGTDRRLCHIEHLGVIGEDSSVEEEEEEEGGSSEAMAVEPAAVVEAEAPAPKRQRRS